MRSTHRPTQNSLTVMVPRRQVRVYLPEYRDGNFHKLLVFGPNYRAKERQFWKDFKKQALNHVLDNSQCTLPELMNTMGYVEEEAKAAYANEELKNMPGPEFQEMMAEDGCLFVLLAFSVLGAGAELKFCEDHPVFGIGCAKEETTSWLSSMFIVGNQVPFVVLGKLMELRFFQELKGTKQWKKPLELAKRTLHKFLIVGQQPHPVDLIHCLQLIILGTASGSDGAIPIMADDMDGIFSASQLTEYGVQLKKLEGKMGSRGIHYKRSIFNATLYLPIFRVDRHTELIVECLRKYEIVQERRGIESEASSFLVFLSLLIRTRQDLEVLFSSGVIEGETERVLNLLGAIDWTVESPHLCNVMRQIKEDPLFQWRRFIKRILKCIATLSTCLIFLFAYLQAQYTMLGYYKKCN